VNIAVFVNIGKFIHGSDGILALCKELNFLRAC